MLWKILAFYRGVGLSLSFLSLVSIVVSFPRWRNEIFADILFVFIDYLTLASHHTIFLYSWPSLTPLYLPTIPHLSINSRLCEDCPLFSVRRFYVISAAAMTLLWAKELRTTSASNYLESTASAIWHPFGRGKIPLNGFCQDWQWDWTMVEVGYR